MSQNRYSIKFTSIAEVDLNGTYEYIYEELFDEAAANNLMEKIETDIMRLREYPFYCSYVSDKSLKARGYRRLIIDNYIVFYLVNEDEQQVIIMRILYGARNYENLL